MKIIKTATNARGRRVVTVELEAEEQLLHVVESHFYRLGGQTDLLVEGHVLTGMSREFWDSIEQRWRAA